MNMEERKLTHFQPLLLLMVCDVPWAPTICTDFDTHLKPSMGTWMRLIHHYTSNQTMGSHPYRPHKTKTIYHGWMDENWGTSCSCLGWYAIYNELQPSIQVLTPLSIHLWMHVWGWVTIVQETKQRVTYLLATQHPNDVPWVDGWKLGHFHPLPWMVCGVPWAPTSPYMFWQPYQSINGCMGKSDTLL